jgi:hypothetical protein
LVVTGGTFSNGSINFISNSGSIFSVTGLTESPITLELSTSLFSKGINAGQGATGATSGQICFWSAS